MKKSVVLKGLFSSLMAMAVMFGIFFVSAPTADASFQCPPRLLGNQFSHVASDGLICCCIYVSPGGAEVVGPSWYC
jgi:hypothetical protein